MTPQEIYINALLADATYVLGDDLSDFSEAELLNQLERRMTKTVASYIMSEFTLVTYIDSDDTIGSGFDASVWKRKSDGKIYVSMQGTSEFQDFLTDVELTFSGDADSQVRDMINWWLRITTPTTEFTRQIVTSQGNGEYRPEAFVLTSLPGRLQELSATRLLN